MFRLDADCMRVLFTFEDRELAIGLADLEGFDIISEGRQRRGRPGGVRWGVLDEYEKGQIDPSQVSPGVWSYRLAYRKRRAS